MTSTALHPSLLTSPSNDEDLEWLKVRFGPYSVENPPPQPMEISVRGGDYHAVAFILAMRRRSRSSLNSNMGGAVGRDLSRGHHSSSYSTTGRNINLTSRAHWGSRKDLTDEHPFALKAKAATAAFRSGSNSSECPLSAEHALYARPGQLKRDKPLGLNQTYLHLACQYVIHDDPSVLWNMIDILLHEGYDPMAKRTDGATPLHILVQEQPEGLESIRLLDHYGADVNNTTEKGLTALHTLAHSYRPGCLEAMKLLVSLGADVKAISLHGWSVMHTFARYNAEPYDCIKYLIEHGVSVHSQTDEQCTVLHALARCIFKGEYSRASKDMLKSIKLVVEHGVDVNAKTVKQWTALHYTAKDNPEPVEALRYLLEHGADVTVIGADGWSVLHCLVRYNHTPLEGIKLLVNAGVDVNVLKTEQVTALHSLAKHCQDPFESYESIKVLLDAGVDVNKRGKKEWTTLHFLVYSNRKPMRALRLLLEAGAKVHDKTADGWSPTHLLANSNLDPLEALKILVEFGADVNAVGKNGWSVLHSVARCTPQPLESIRFLLQNGADPTVTTQDGWSILHFLANYCTEPLESMRLLIEAGADVNAKTKSDWTALHLVARANNQPLELFKLLLSYNADATAIGHKDWTVLHSLVRYNPEPYDCIQILLDAGADFTKKTGGDWTCMDLLTRYCPDPVPSMTLLLSKGAVLTSQSIFHVAEHNQDPVPVLELILRHNPRGVTDQDNKGNTAMHVIVSCQKKAIPALETLLRHGADINAKGNQGRTPLHDAIEIPDQQDQEELLDWMLGHGADPYQAFDENGPMNAMLLAARIANEVCVRVLWDWIGDDARSEAQGRRVREFLRKQIQRRREMNSLEPPIRLLRKRMKKKMPHSEGPITKPTLSTFSGLINMNDGSDVAGLLLGPVFHGIGGAGTGPGSFLNQTGDSPLSNLVPGHGLMVGSSYMPSGIVSALAPSNNDNSAEGFEEGDEDEEEDEDYEELMTIGRGVNDTMDEEAARLRAQNEDMTQLDITGKHEIVQ
ncbi:BCL-6 corepressor-like protein 1 [Lunasporangiospora selenospora]|uniref:BCL-6 corepressor-like protein 1 n=1 Tax=Lunasporangiospora selenospora TaxID=979761 RepID=A0A9P6FR51_9FUNG|nr:BCL-6 corepressor-like protein 1 [Lunasporangiospora selenospora]